MESLPAALPVAGHAGSAGRLALPPVVLADIAGLWRVAGEKTGGRERRTEGQKIRFLGQTPLSSAQSRRL